MGGFYFLLYWQGSSAVPTTFSLEYSVPARAFDYTAPQRTLDYQAPAPR
jgi:hypothetical protein